MVERSEFREPHKNKQVAMDRLRVLLEHSHVAKSTVPDGCRELDPDSRVPDDYRNQATGYRAGWNDCRSAMLAAVPKPAASDHQYEVERWTQDVLNLVKQYGNERATEAYHGDFHCRKAPKEVFAEIEKALAAVPKQDNFQRAETIVSAWPQWKQDYRLVPGAKPKPEEK